ncbi:MAG: BMC domain-containing protein [Bacteroidota bacterium]
MAAPVPEGAALGLLETLGLVAAVEAADAMLKASEVRLVRQQRTNPALVTHLVVGDTAAVRAAVDAGAAAAERVGRVAARHVIPRPAPDVWRRLVGVLPGVPEAESAPPTSEPPASGRAASGHEYGAMTVRALRSLARDRDDDRLRGRAIARASKDELVDFLRRTEAA